MGVCAIYTKGDWFFIATFAVLFGIRLAILIIGDIIAPGIMAMIDFMAVFFGAFVVIPLLLVDYSLFL